MVLIKALLSTPPGKTSEKWPPLGLLYIASSLKNARGDEVGVVDAFCENLTRADLVERVAKEAPEVFGMNCSTHTFLETIATLKDISERLPDTKIILGGYHATFASEQILSEYPFVDYIVKGEAEHALAKLFDHLERGEAADDVEGISYLRDGKLVSNPLSLIQDLDSLPFPDRSLLHGVKYGYSHEGIPLTFGKFTTISTSRGCPFRCTYCSCAAFSLRRWRQRSAENVVAELKLLDEQGYENCVMVDDNFTHNPKRAERICELIREEGIHMQFYCEGRVDSAKPELLRTMKRAGFDVIYFGAESACERTLEFYKKQITPQKTHAAIRNAKNAGMLVITSYIIGAPVESKTDIEQTIRFIGETRPHAIQMNILDCLVGTAIWEDLVRQGIVKPEDWHTNHRVYEYFTDGLKKDELEALVAEGYAQWLKGWYTKNGLLELLKLIRSNHTARRIIFSNLLNPNVRKRISEGMRPRQSPETQLGRERVVDEKGVGSGPNA